MRPTAGLINFSQDSGDVGTKFRGTANLRQYKISKFVVSVNISTFRSQRIESITDEAHDMSAAQVGPR